jgi:hypothetical protein
MKTSSSSKTTANSPNLTKDALIRARVTTRFAGGCIGAGVSGGPSCPVLPPWDGAVMNTHAPSFPSAMLKIADGCRAAQGRTSVAVTTKHSESGSPRLPV